MTAPDELRAAVREGNVEAARAALDRGAPADATDFYGDTLVDVARDRGFEELALLS